MSIIEYSLETWYLHHPANAVRVHVVSDGPLCQLVPLVVTTAVDRQAQLGILVLTLFEVIDHLLQGNTIVRADSRSTIDGSSTIVERRRGKRKDSCACGRIIRIQLFSLWRLSRKLANV